MLDLSQIKYLVEMKARITKIGSYTPSKRMKNADFEKFLETSDEWIYSRTGIRERCIAEEGESTSDLAIKAALRLMQQSIDPSTIDLILVCSMSSETLCPSIAALVQDKIGAVHAAAFDLSAACSGFLYGLSTAKAFIESGMYRTILLIGAEKMSSIVDWKDRSTCVLFGDGAAAVLVESEGSGLWIRDILLGSDGSFGHLLTLSSKEMILRMQGREVFKHGVRKMARSAQDLLERGKLTVQEIDYLVPHQANARLIQSVCEQLEYPAQKLYLNVERYGNTSAASIPLALEELWYQEKFQEGKKILLLAFGGGLTWGSALLQMEGG